MEIKEFYHTTSRIVVIGVVEIKAILSLDLWLFLVILSYSDHLIEYFWLVHGKPLANYFLAFFFGVLSIAILYAEIANVFNFEHNLIYDFFQATSSSEDSPNYFYLSNVRIYQIIFNYS